MITDENLSKKADGSPSATVPSVTNRNGNDAEPRPRLIPVLRTKRCTWTIPRLNEQVLQQAQLDEVRRLKQEFRGTTWEGRELFRKILAGIEHRLRQPGTTIQGVIDYARGELNSFPSLGPEFKRLFVMGCGQAKGVNLGSITVNGMATILVVRKRARLVVSRELEAAPAGA